MAPRKANQARLTAETIVSTTLRLIDEQGLESMSMRQLGGEIGVDASTIYYHIPNKEALYDLIVDEILGGIDVDPSLDDRSAGLEERVLRAGREYRRALLRHPRAMPLVAQRSLSTPAQLRVVEALSTIFFDQGFSPVEVLISMDICGMTILGMTNMHAAAITRTQDESHPGGAASPELPEDQYPNLRRMLAEVAGVHPDLEFERAMRAMAKGLLAMHEEGTLQPAKAEQTDPARGRQ